MINRFVAALLLFVLCNPIAAQDSGVTLKSDGDTLQVHIGNQHFATYRYGKDLPKPFLEPLHAADGTVLTRSLVDPEDHPHHKGIWVSVDEVNEVKYWNEDGRIENVSVKIAGNGNPARFRVVNHWLAKDGNPVVAEHTEIAIHSNQLLSYDIRLEALADRVEFGDTKEGLFGFRMANWMREKEGGHVVNARGEVGTEKCWGKTANWIDYHATKNGRTYGLAIFDHPLNFRPSRYHVRNYGLFSVSPFGESAYTKKKRPADTVILSAGGSLRLRYAMYPHIGDTSKADVAGTYLEYLKQD